MIWLYVFDTLSTKIVLVDQPFREKEDTWGTAHRTMIKAKLAAMYVYYTDLLV